MILKSNFGLLSSNYKFRHICIINLQSKNTYISNLMLYICSIWAYHTRIYIYILNQFNNSIKYQQFLTNLIKLKVLMTLYYFDTLYMFLLHGIICVIEMQTWISNKLESIWIRNEVFLENKTLLREGFAQWFYLYFNLIEIFNF